MIAAAGFGWLAVALVFLWRPSGLDFMIGFACLLFAGACGVWLMVEGRDA